jgi:hypothetical protein
METWQTILIAGAILIVAIGLFIGSYLLNKKTPKPEGCEDTSKECGACGIVSCSHHPINNKEKGDK